MELLLTVLSACGTFCRFRGTIRSSVEHFRRNRGTFPNRLGLTLGLAFGYYIVTGRGRAQTAWLSSRPITRT